LRSAGPDLSGRKSDEEAPSFSVFAVRDDDGNFRIPDTNGLGERNCGVDEAVGLGDKGAGADAFIADMRVCAGDS
jgi:hypothetical protein